jgi:hypothetical protein
MRYVNIYQYEGDPQLIQNNQQFTYIHGLIQNMLLKMTLNF